MTDAINPQHYKHLPAEAIDIIEAAIAKAPSNEAAYLHGQALKYLLRCWHKKGIEDLRKAQWYLDRLVNRDQLAEVAGAIPDLPIEEPKPSRTQPPSGYRMLGDAKDEPRIEGDQYWSLAIRGWTVLTSFKVEYANRDNWAACRKIEEPSEDRIPHRWRKMEIGEDIDQDDKFWYEGRWVSYEKDKPPMPRGKLTDFHVTHIRKIEKPKRYREPTLEDLKNGPIKCEVRNSDNEKDDWASRVLVFVSAYHSCKFVTVDPADRDRICTWIQGRIEVQE